MTVQAPHFVLFSESTSAHEAPESIGRATTARGAGVATKCWHFILRSPDGSTRLDVADVEYDASDERLELLAVVRGLEALEQPSEVTLVTSSNAIRRGLRFGLDMWRDNQWQWERFGRMTPIKNADLWRRVDRALQVHQVDFRVIRFDRPADDLTRPVPKFLFRDSAHTGAPDENPRHAEEGGPSSSGSTKRAFGAGFPMPEWARFWRWGGREPRAGAAPRRLVSGSVTGDRRFDAARHPPYLSLISRTLRRLFGWCGLCRSRVTLVITAH